MMISRLELVAVAIQAGLADELRHCTASASERFFNRGFFFVPARLN